MVEVWVADLEVPAWVEASLSGLLDDDEQARAKAFRFDHLRRRFTVSHAMLRSLLADELDVEPGSLRFTTGEHGKPALAVGGGGIEFNLSHSGERALVAVRDDEAVGVDIEQIRPLSHLEGIARRILSDEELAAFMAAPDKAHFVLTAWTAKEAVVKASGDGIIGSLRGLDTSGCAPLDVGDAYVAAVASPGRGWEPVLRDWRPPA